MRRTITRLRRRPIPFIAVLVLVAAIVPGAESSGVADALVRSAAVGAQPLPAGSTSIGAVPATSDVTIDIVLAPPDPADEAAMLQEIEDPSSPMYHHWLTPTAFAERFGPTISEVTDTEAWLSSIGLTVTARQGSILKVAATAEKLGGALGVHFNRYRLAGGARVFHADGAPLVSSAVLSDVTAITGLDNIPVFQPRRTASSTPAQVSPHVSAPVACSQATLSAQTTMDRVGTFYGVNSLFSAGLFGTGETIALVEFAPHVQSDITEFNTCFGLSNAVTTAPIDGGSPGDPNGTVEADLDVEEAESQAPGSSVVSYEAPNTFQGDEDMWNAIVSADTAKVISTSWGECEPDQFGSHIGRNEASADDVNFAQAALQGQTIVSAAGDSGSEDCNGADGTTTFAVDFPSSDPHVTSVGGTTIFGGAEEVWNDGPGYGAGGGGKSTRYAMTMLPQQQPYDVGGSTMREVPDLSGDAGTSQAIYTSGDTSGDPDPNYTAAHWAPIDGTSAAAPMVGGFIADINEGCSTTVGDLAPDLYQYATNAASLGGSLYTYALNDVVSGNNDLTRTQGGNWASGIGYDLATGLGTPRLSGLACPQVTSLSPASASTGSLVTITGTNLLYANFTYGGAPITVTSRTATSAQFAVPFYGGTSVIAASTPLGTGNQTALFTNTDGTAPTTTTTTTSTTVPTTTTTSTTTTTTTTTTAPRSTPTTNAPTATATGAGVGAATTTVPFRPVVTTTTVPAPTPVATLTGSVSDVTKGVVTSSVKCAVVTCRGKVLLTETITIRVRVKKKLVTETTTVTIGSVSYSAKKGATAKLTIRLNARGVADLATHHGKLAVTESVTVSGGSTKKRKVTLVAAPKKIPLSPEKKSS